MSYEAQPGTIPHRVIEHLKGLPEGTELSTTDLSIMLGWDSARGLKSYLQPAVEGGALAVRVGGARLSFFRLGDGKPLFAKEDDKTVAHVPVTAVSSIFAYADQRQAASFSTAEHSDGRVTIQRHGRVIVELTPEEAREHRAFLKAEASKKVQREMRLLEQELRERSQQHQLFREEPPQARETLSLRG